MREIHKKYLADFSATIYIRVLEYCMKFSVVIPLYNKEHYIIDTIKSVLNQTFRDYELIVVDDGSKDHSYEAAKSLESDKIVLLHQENQGVAVARNIGIENARGEYIAFLDADDYWYSDYLETIDDLIQRFPDSDMFVTSYRVNMGKGKYHYSAHLSDEPTLLPSYWVTYKNAYDTVWTSATVIRREAILKAGMFTPGEKIGQDLDLWARVAKNNPLVAYSPKVCVDYNRDAEQNARTRVKIAYPKAFLGVLKEEMGSSRWNEEDKKWMLSKYNKKMIVYVFTSIIAGERQQARRVLRDWKKEYDNIYIAPLYCASFLPNSINKFVYKIRMKVF